MKYLLVVMFYLNGEDQPPVFVDGYLPLQFSTQSECEKKRAFIEAQFNKNLFPPNYLSCFKSIPAGTEL